jgi:hypothetical protein
MKTNNPGRKPEILNSMDHPLSRRHFLKLGAASIIGISALRRLLVREETKLMIKDKGAWFVVIDPPYYGIS